MLKCGLTTRTWSTSKQPRNSIGDRLSGHFTFCVLISNFSIGLGAPWASWMHCLIIWIMVWGQAITATWFYFAWPELFAVCALEGLTLVGEECGIVGNIGEAFGKEVVEDKVAVAVRKL